MALIFLSSPLNRYEECSNALKLSLQQATSVSITTDGWTSNTTESYITVTCHYIDNEWNLKSSVLQTRAYEDRHTGENLAALLKSVVEEWGLEGKILACVHDNASNIVSANSPQMVPWKSAPCFAHTLQLAINDGMRIVGVEEVVQVCNKLVSHFHHSTLASKCLEEKQKSLNLPIHRLIVSCKTRWNSIIDMFERLHSQRQAVSAVLADRRVTKLNEEKKLAIPDSSWQVIEDFIPVLKALKCATTALGTEVN